jgi:ribosomal protein S18 acetylase RimI-like enzyme
MFQIKTMSAEDFSYATQLSNTADWNMSDEDFQLTVNLEPEGCFVAYQGSERLGIATCISYGKLGWFGNLIVAEPHRGKGVGAFLVKHALKYLRGKGVETVGLYAVSNLVGFYRKFGFRKDIEFTVLHKQSPTAASKVKLNRAKEQDVSALMALDVECFGADRRKLLNAIISKESNLCYYLPNNGEIKGYVAAKVYAEMAEVGPLICKDDDSAKMLLEAVMDRLQGLYVTICLPKKEISLINFLSRLGFEEDFNVPRMFLGSPSAMECVYVAESLERG